MSAGVEIRFTDIPPPEPEPKQSLYTDLVNLPDPVKLGLTARIFNYDDVALYMKVDGYAAAWTFTTNNLGSLASGANAYYNLDNFGTRTKPGSATTENITVRLRAYTDSGYTNLKWTYERVLELVFINSADGTWTQNFLNNFDDGTVQGWSYTNETGHTIYFWGVTTDYVLSTPYALELWQYDMSTTLRFSLYKNFITPNRSQVLAIIDVRTAITGTLNYRDFLANNVVLVHLKGAATKWTRIVMPIPPNQTVEIRIRQEGAPASANKIWMDDFKIISKG